MQICTLTQTHNHASIPPLSFFVIHHCTAYELEGCGCEHASGDFGNAIRLSHTDIYRIFFRYLLTTWNPRVWSQVLSKSAHQMAEQVNKRLCDLCSLTVHKSQLSCTLQYNSSVNSACCLGCQFSPSWQRFYVGQFCSTFMFVCMCGPCVLYRSNVPLCALPRGVSCQRLVYCRWQRASHGPRYCLQSSLRAGP